MLFHRAKQRKKRDGEGSEDTVTVQAVKYQKMHYPGTEVIFFFKLS